MLFWRQKNGRRKKKSLIIMGRRIKRVGWSIEKRGKRRRVHRKEAKETGQKGKKKVKAKEQGKR